VSVEDTTPESLRQTVRVRTGPLTEAFAVGELVGELELRDGRVKFTATQGKSRQRHWLERRTGIAGLAERIQGGESVLVLDAPVSEVSVRFSKLAFGSILILKAAGKRWRFVFFDPRASPDITGAVMVYPRMIKGAKLAAPWREAFRNRRTSNTAG
jgi:hypothetical protein